MRNARARFEIWSLLFLLKSGSAGITGDLAYVVGRTFERARNSQWSIVGNERLAELAWPMKSNQLGNDRARGGIVVD